tara:strand:- start:2616 stop:3413 length:798 start_codon:yes stop_codon:yes gene_type:complete
MKTILITGSTDGIGKLTAIQLAKDGHHIYLHGRNSDKLANTISEVKSISNNENINGFVADFSNLNDVRKMAHQVKTELNKLDVLINNAGIFKSPISKTTGGLEIRMTVNFLAPYLLTNELLSLIDNSESPRIVNLSSAAQSPVSLTALAGNEELEVNTAYAQSKLALTMWSFDLAKNHQNIAVLAVNPGSLLNTKMAKEAYGQHWSPAEKGVDILYDLALSENHKNNSGKYFDNDKGAFGKAHNDVYDREKIDKLIAETNQILNN